MGGLFDFLKKKKSSATSSANLMSTMRANQEAMYSEAQDADELVGSTGKFGLEVDNPIPTRSKLGSLEYLNSLVTEDGHDITYKRIASLRAITFPETPVDGYAITRSDGQPLGMLYLCMYHKRNSNKLPRGFKKRRTEKSETPL
jgi:hypothetical protein